jgi:hypothetical protein
MPMRTLTLVLFGLVLEGALVEAGQPAVVNPRVTTDSSIDCSSAEAVVRQITKPDMTDEQKAVACWRFMLDHYYHWNAPKEPEVFQEVRDFAKEINSYGFGPCYVNAPVVTALWEACGFETRCWTITGHTIPEVKYGGAWHLLDADARGWHRKADGGIASVEELAADPRLFTEPKEKSDPYYPYGAPDAAVKPFKHWGPPSKIMDLYASRNDNYAFNRRAVMSHPMYLTLRQGEKIVLSSANEGKWYQFPGLDDEDKKTGPVEVDRKVTYGSGRLGYNPDLKKVSTAELLWLGSKNVKLDGGKLVAEKEGEPAVAVFRVWSPYVLVEAKVSAALAGEGKPKVELSVDGGAAWAEPADSELKGGGGASGLVLALNTQIAGRYEYLLRFTLDKSALAGLTFDSTFQLAPLALPRLKVGKNKVTVFRGPDEGHVQLCLGPGKVGKERYLVESLNIEVPKSLAPEKWGEPAFAVFKLSAPAELTALSLGGNLSFNTAKDQLIEFLYSLDAGKTWTTAFKYSENANRDHSQFEMDKHIRLDNAAGAREALVKIAMQRNSKYFGISQLRLYAFYQQPQPEGARLAVELAWQEKTGDKWEEKSKSLIAGKFPQEFEIECGGEAVKLARISMGVE